ncbi:hypothetical protein F0U61_40885 [Archangium violaceum]|uniref:hypothetical protein n=1 Tax=Archangium violaceum TaxID=83451 RepID=UPI002B2FA5BD|nr:hypothetical protein F0U61_40885 [Archangium violaceum]
MSAPAPNPEAIRSTWRWLAHAAHGVSEVRVILPGAGILGIGFFDDEEAFVRECMRANDNGNVYVGIQPRPLGLLARAPNTIRPLKTGAGSKDVEVVTATVIDLDPVRPKDTASTNEELALAVQSAEAAAAWCEAQGLVRPRLVMSGNGAQLWFALPPLRLEGERRGLVQAGLRAFEAELRAQVQSKSINVDSIHDVARIIKVVGTVSRKGKPTAERPHRIAAAPGGLMRMEDARLAERLMQSVPVVQGAVRERSTLPRVQGARGLELGAVKARRTPEGEYGWKRPVEMCGAIQRLWEQGAEDRSLAIFDMVRFFMHKGLGLDELTPLILDYDRRLLGKLEGRDGPAYVRQCYEKILATAHEDGWVAPPCRSLQRLGYCQGGGEPGARCEVEQPTPDIERSIDAVPTDAPVRELEQHLKPILGAIAQRDPAVQGKYLGLIEKRFGLKQRDLRRALERASTGAVRQGRNSREDGAAEEESALEGEIHEGTNCYYSLGARGERRVVSSFIITPTARVETEDGELLVGNVRTDQGTALEGLRFPLSAFHSKRDLIRHLPSADLQWTGNDNNVQGLLRLLARQPAHRRPGASMLGDYKQGEHHIWLGPDCTIGVDGFLSPPPVVYVPSGGSLDQRVRYQPVDDAVFHRVARVVFEHLPNVNRPEVLLPILGWFFATPFKPRLMERVGSFPSLFIWGTQGSGKSSLCMDVFWPLFGVRAAEPYSATETEFALLKLLSSTRSVPVFIDEYKPYDMPQQRLNVLHRYLRRLYRGETEERGRPDLRVKTYHLQAPVCIAGETRPTEAALLERILTANPLKTTLKEKPACLTAFKALRAVDLPLFAPRYIQFCLGRDFDTDLRLARAVSATLLNGREVPVRVAENITAMLLGIHLFEEFASFCGYSLPGDLGARAAVDAVLVDVLEMGQGVKNALDHFVEMLGVMAIQGELRHRVHYVFDDGRLCVHLESAYDSFRQHCRRIDYTSEVVDLKALRRLIHENQLQGGYVVAEGERICFAGKANRRRAIIIDLTRTSLISPDDFPQPNDERDTRESFKSRYGWSDAS